jgi:hypothetical protein
MEGAAIGSGFVHSTVNTIEMKGAVLDGMSSQNGPGIGFGYRYDSNVSKGRFCHNQDWIWNNRIRIGMSHWEVICALQKNCFR